MSWYNTEGNLSHHIIRSETKYIRNFQAIPFSNRVSKAQFDSLKQKTEKLLEKNGFKKESFGKRNTSQLFSFAEKGFCDADPSMLKGSLALDDGIANSTPITTDTSRISLFFNDPCSLAVCVGGRDLLVIRSLLSGKAIKETQSIALEAEELFDREFEFAYSEKIGYLSPIVSNCGSGEYFSALLYLPAIKQLGALEQILSLAHACHASLSPLLADRENMGDMYVITHSPSHLCDHLHAAAGFDALLCAIVEKEKEAESIIFAQEGKLIIERAYRAYGSLMYAQHISEGEMLSLLSSLRFCLAASPSSCPPISLNTLNSLLAEGMNFSVLSGCPECNSSDELEENRADLIKKALSSDKMAQ